MGCQGDRRTTKQGEEGLCHLPILRLPTRSRTGIHLSRSQAARWYYVVSGIGATERPSYQTQPSIDPVRPVEMAITLYHQS